MQKTQLIQLLKILSAKELTQFNVYLNRVERPSNKLAVKLFLRLKKYAPNYDSPKLDRHKIEQFLFDLKESKALNKIVFTLKELLQNFLVLLEIENNSLLKEQLLVKALKDRNHPTYAKRSRQLIETIHKRNDKKADHLTLFQLNYALSADANTAKIGSDLKELNAANQYLDQFYFYHKLKIILEHHIARKINNSSWSINQEGEILEILKKYPILKDDPTIKLLLLTIELIAAPKKENYLQLKTKLFEQMLQLSKKDLRDFIMTFIFHCTQKLSTDFSFYIQEGFELYKFADQLNLLVINGRMRDLEYTNAASVGFSTKNEVWTQEFISRNKVFLAPNIRDALYAYVNAIYAFKKGAFENVIKLLFLYSNDPELALNTNILIKSLLLRTHFELYHQNNLLSKQHQFLYSQSSSFERVLKSKKKLSPDKTASYLLFLSYFNQLIKVLPTSDTQKINCLHTEINENEKVALKTWLLSKLG